MEVFLQYFEDPELFILVLLVFGFIVGFITFFIIYTLDCIGILVRDLIKERQKKQLERESEKNVHER